MSAVERWLPVVGWEGIYEVSDLGRIKSLPRLIAWRSDFNWLPGGILSCNAPNKSGHISVALSRDGNQLHRHVHSLVLLAFVGPCPDGMEGCHRDGNPSDNAVTNLRWGTRSENMRDRVAHGGDLNANKTHCPQGHPYDAANTYVKPNSNGRASRACRTCKAASNRAWRVRAKVAS